MKGAGSFAVRLDGVIVGWEWHLDGGRSRESL